MRPIALLSDFGLQDSFAGEVRATVYRLSPQRSCFDLSHGVPRGEIRAAAWMLASAWPHLPTDCIVCAMVDPGVGAPGRIILAQNEGKALLSPDNGTVSLIHRIYNVDYQVFHARHTPFLGRDSIVPLAIQWAEGCVSGLATDQKPFLELPPSSQGPILYVDHFGNVILDLHISEWNSDRAKTMQEWLKIKKIGDIPHPDTPFAFHSLPENTIGLYWGSSGFLEVALSRGSASFQLGIKSSSFWE